MKPGLTNGDGQMSCLLTFFFWNVVIETVLVLGIQKVVL